MALKIEDMTWDEVEKYLKKKKGLIIPVGTCEQHGKHLPLNHDCLLAEYIANYLSTQTDVAVAPILNYGINLPCDKYLAGTTSLKADDLKKSIKSLIEWWEFQGFKKFYLITFHADPVHIDSLLRIDKNIVLIKPWKIKYDDILEKQETIKHACEAETSIALYLHPNKVRENKIEEHDIPIEEFRSYLNHEKSEKIKDYVGCLGFPSYATEEKGEEIVERMKKKVLESYEKQN
jgi:creatinine amidohydrolase